MHIQHPKKAQSSTLRFTTTRADLWAMAISSQTSRMISRYPFSNENTKAGFQLSIIDFTGPRQAGWCSILCLRRGRSATCSQAGSSQRGRSLRWRPWRNPRHRSFYMASQAGISIRPLDICCRRVSWDNPRKNVAWEFPGKRERRTRELGLWDANTHNRSR